MSTARQAAIAAVTNYKSNGKPLNFVETPASELFSSNVFHDGVMKDRLPKATYKALQATIKKGATLDATVADAVALAASCRNADVGQAKAGKWNDVGSHGLG